MALFVVFVWVRLLRARYLYALLSRKVFLFSSFFNFFNFCFRHGELPGPPGTSRGGGADVSDVYSGDPRAPLVSDTAGEDVFGIIASGDSFVAESPGFSPVAASAATNAWTGKRPFSHVVSPKPPVHTSTVHLHCSSRTSRQDSARRDKDYRRSDAAPARCSL